MKVRVVHGYGSTGEGGAIRPRLRGFCDRHSDRMSYVRGEAAERDPGLTIVTVSRALPDARERLGDKIVAYCARPKTMDRIAGRFRREGGPAVADVIHDRAQRGRLKKTRGRHNTEYSAW